MMALKGAVKKRFLDINKHRRVLQPEEMYDKMYKERITEHLSAHTATEDSIVEDDRPIRTKRMAERRAARKLCWENETEEVRQVVLDAIAKERDEYRAESQREAADSSIESKSPAEIQESVFYFVSALKGSRLKIPIGRSIS
jgi:hypothetical protein